MMRLMIYGATGYTGRMAAALAQAAGVPLLLAGRNASALQTMAQELGVDHLAFALDDHDSLDAGLQGVSVVLNTAGPFRHTAGPIMRAALRREVHYLDVAAELDSYHLAAELDDAARAAGVMLLPGSGGSVAMLGSLAARAARRLDRPRRVSIALNVAGPLSRGSAITAAQGLVGQVLMRMDDRLVESVTGSRDFDFGQGPVACFPVTLPDLITIARQTGASDVETFVHVTGDAFPGGDLSDMPDGPSARDRMANRYQAAVTVTGADGTIVDARLDTVNGYGFTALAAVEAARRVLAGEVHPGFQTPAGLFGAGFAETIADTTITLVATPARRKAHAP